MRNRCQLAVCRVGHRTDKQTDKQTDKPVVVTVISVPYIGKKIINQEMSTIVVVSDASSAESVSRHSTDSHQNLSWEFPRKKRFYLPFELTTNIRNIHSSFNSSDTQEAARCDLKIG
jgi:hypothetical protein